MKQFSNHIGVERRYVSFYVHHMWQIALFLHGLKANLKEIFWIDSFRNYNPQIKETQISFKWQEAFLRKQHFQTFGIGRILLK